PSRYTRATRPAGARGRWALVGRVARTVLSAASGPRCVGPTQVARITLVTSVDHTDAAKVPREIFRGDRARRGGNVSLPREFADNGSTKFARARLFTMSSGVTSPGPRGGASHVGQFSSSLPDP